MKVEEAMKQFTHVEDVMLADIKSMLEDLNNNSVDEVMAFWEKMENKNLKDLKIKIEKVSEREYRDWKVKVYIENTEPLYNLLIETVEKVISKKWELYRAARILRSNIGEKLDGSYVTLQCLTELIQENVDETIEHRKNKEEM